MDYNENDDRQSSLINAHHHHHDHSHHHHNHVHDHEHNHPTTTADILTAAYNSSQPALRRMNSSTVSRSRMEQINIQRVCNREMWETANNFLFYSLIAGCEVMAFYLPELLGESRYPQC